VDHGHWNTLLLEVKAEQLADHVSSGFTSMMTVHPSSLAFSTEAN
jgi:hypothetical protein